MDAVFKAGQFIVALLALAVSGWTLLRQESYPYEQTIFAERLSAVSSLNSTLEETIARGLTAVQSDPTSPEHAQFGETLPRFYSAAKRVEILMPRSLNGERQALQQAVDAFVGAIATGDTARAEAAAREVVSSQTAFEAAFSETYVDRFEDQ